MLSLECETYELSKGNVIWVNKYPLGRESSKIECKMLFCLGFSCIVWIVTVGLFSSTWQVAFCLSPKIAILDL